MVSHPAIKPQSLGYLVYNWRRKHQGNTSNFNMETTYIALLVTAAVLLLLLFGVGLTIRTICETLDSNVESGGQIIPRNFARNNPILVSAEPSSEERRLLYASTWVDAVRYWDGEILSLFIICLLFIDNIVTHSSHLLPLHFTNFTESQIIK